MPTIILAGSPINQIGQAAAPMNAQLTAIRQQRESRRRFDLEMARRAENDLYARERADRLDAQRRAEFERGIFEADRRFEQGQREFGARQRRLIEGDIRGELREKQRREDADRDFGFRQRQFEESRIRAGLESRRRARRDEIADLEREEVNALRMRREERLLRQLDGPDAPPISARSIQRGIDEIRQLDPDFADDLEAEVRALGGEAGVAGLDVDPVSRMDAYSRVYGGLREVRGAAAQTMQARGIEALEQMAARALNDIQDPEIQRNVAAGLQQLSATLALVDDDPEDAARAAAIAQNRMLRIIDRERRREANIAEADKLLADADPHSVDLHKASRLRVDILTSDDPDKANLDFRAEVVPQEALQRKAGEEDAMERFGLMGMVQGAMDAAGLGGAPAGPAAPGTPDVPENVPASPSGEQGDLDEYTAWLEGYGERQGFNPPGNPVVPGGAIDRALNPMPTTDNSAADAFPIWAAERGLDPRSTKTREEYRELVLERRRAEMARELERVDQRDRRQRRAAQRGTGVRY